MYKSEKLYYRKAFFMAMIMGVILFLPFVLIDGGYFIYSAIITLSRYLFIHFAIRQLKTAALCGAGRRISVQISSAHTRSIRSEARSSG